MSLNLTVVSSRKRLQDAFVIRNTRTVWSLDKYRYLTLYPVSRATTSVKTLVNELGDICGDSRKGKVGPQRAVVSPEGLCFIYI